MKAQLLKKIRKQYTVKWVINNIYSAGGIWLLLDKKNQTFQYYLENPQIGEKHIMMQRLFDVVFKDYYTYQRKCSNRKSRNRQIREYNLLKATI